MYVQERRDPNQEWLPTTYKLTEENVSMIVAYWDKEWKVPVLEEELQQQDEGQKDQEQRNEEHEDEEQLDEERSIDEYQEHDDPGNNVYEAPLETTPQARDKIKY